MYRVNAGPPGPPPARSRTGLVIALVASGVIVGGSVLGATFALVRGSGSSGIFGQGRTWSATPPTFRDLNGDGVDDLVGEGGTGTVAALDGRTGTFLWQKSRTDPTMSHAFVGDHVAFVRGREVDVFDVRTGALVRTVTPSWEDKPSRVTSCDGSLFAIAIDDTGSRIDLRTWAVTPAKLSSSCLSQRGPFSTSAGKAAPPCRFPSASCEVETTGTYGRYATTLRDEASKRLVRISFKEKGTPVATATRDDGASLVVAPDGNLDGVDLAGDWLVVARGAEIFAYDFATKRSWTAHLPTGLKTADSDRGWLRIEKGRVYASTSWKRRGSSGELVALDLTTGARLWK